MITKWELDTVYCDLMYSVAIIQHEGCLNDFVLTCTSSKHIPVLLLETRPNEVDFVQLGGSPQKVHRAHSVLHVQSCVTKLRYKATFLASSNWAFLPSKGRHCLGKAEIRFRETAEPAVSLPSQSSKVGSAHKSGHVELETHLVASQTFDATRWTSREHLNLHLQSDSKEMAQFTWWGSMVQSSTSRAQGLATRP